MIVWSGLGFLSVLVLLGSFIISIRVLPNSLSDYSFVIACFSAAAFSWFFGKRWNSRNVRVVTDDETGQKLRIKNNNHTLFWIPMQYWGGIFSIFGVIFLAQNSVILSAVSIIILAAIVVFEYVSKKAKAESTKNTYTSE